MMAKIHGQLTGGKEQIKVEYEKNVEAEKFREQLYSKRNKDISSGTTSVGPHRDDLRFKVGELIFVNLAHKDSKGRLRCH